MLMPVRSAVLGVLVSSTALLACGLPAQAATGPTSTGPTRTTSVAADDVIGGPELATRGVVVHLGPGATPLPDIQAASWLLADLTTGEVLAAKSAHRRARPASTLKTLTSVTLLPRLDPDAIHRASYAEATAEGGRVGIVPDATYSIWDLWHGLLLPSGNDAAAALANANGGMASTVADMQAMAATLQARDTTVRNASGLDADNQLSSAYDLALFAKAAMRIPEFRTITKSLRYDFPGRPTKAGKKRPTYKIYTQNRLLLNGYRGAVGGKTGYTSLAHRTFWGAATRNGHTLVVTLLQVTQPTETAAKSLLTWGFRNVDALTPVGTLVDPIADEPSASPSPSATAAPAAGDGTTATGSSTSATTTSAAPWLALGAVAAALVLAYAVLRRRRRSRRADIAPGGSPDTVLPGVGGVPTAAPPVSAAADVPTETPVADAAGPSETTQEIEPVVPPEAVAPPRTPGGHVRIITPPTSPPSV